MSKKKKEVKAIAYTRMTEYFVIDNAGHKHEVEYVIKAYETEEGILVEMHYADNAVWDEKIRNQKVASVLVKEDGEGYKWNLMPVAEEHDYSDAYVMGVMMDFLDSLNSVKCVYSIVETSPVVNVHTH